MNQTEIISLLERKISLTKRISPSQDSSQSLRKGKWTAEEDENLRYLLSIFGERNWKKVSEHMDGRSSIQCLHRWTKILKPGLIKGPWTLEEDKKLIEWVQREGPIKWSRAAQFIPGRSGKQCRERWLNNLSPNLKKSNWSDEEDELIFALYKKYGSAWSKIAKHFHGRTENSIKNRFYSTIRRLALDRSRQNSTSSLDGKSNPGIKIPNEESKDSLLIPIIEKIQNRKSKEGTSKAQEASVNGDVQSILQEIQQNYKNSKESLPTLAIKKEFSEDTRVYQPIKQEDTGNAPVPKSGEEIANDHNILRSLMVLERGFNSIRNEGVNPQKENKFSCRMENTGNTLNEVFNEFLIEEQMIDQSILQLIRQIKNIECLLMDKTKEHLEKEMILKQEQMEMSSATSELKRKGGYYDSWNNNVKKIKVN